MLKISHLQKHYRGFSLDCSMEVQPGMITGLIGRNGSGKSTTFKALLGLIHPDGGEIEVFGKKAEELKPEDKQKLGVVFADSGFSMYLTAAGVANIMKSIYPDFDRDEFLQQCRRFNLPTDKKIKEFSTGMKAKFKVLAALSHKAELLILDEPTVGLDVIARDEVLNMLREYMEENESSSILISSHISSDLESLCDDFYMIHAGKIILHEDTDVLLSDYAVLKVSEEEYEKLDQQYLIKIRKEAYGYRCLTNQKQFYMENYPDVVIENGKIDDLVVMMAGSGSVSFATGYFTIVTAIFAITTISYDEFDNGLAFLMTLPVTRKQYVAEKYLLGAGLTAVAWGIATITGVICKGVAELQGCLSETIIGSLIYIPLALLMLAVSLPLVIHFGAEKGRYIAMVMWAIIFAVVYILIKTMGLSADAVDAWLNGLNRGMVLVGVVLFTVIVYMGSFGIGVRLMEKKEF